MDIHFCRLLRRALCLHLLLALFIHVAGRHALLPSLFDHNGTGQTFAYDAHHYRAHALQLAGLFRTGGGGKWLAAAAPLHTRLYSLSFLLFGPLCGFSDLSVEPLNLCYYLAILLLVYRIGAEVYGPRAGRQAATVVMLWPSFLLHSTQVLHDPLFLCIMLAEVLICVLWLTRTCSIRFSLLAGGTGAVLSGMLWQVRVEMWDYAPALVLLTGALLLVRLRREGWALLGNGIGLTWLLCLTLALPVLHGTLRPSRASVHRALLALADKPRQLRHQFIARYPDAGSNLDTQVRLSTPAEVIRHVPRAAAIGLWAPFPRTWFVPGTQVSLWGKLLIGLETLLLYLAEVLLCRGVFRGRRSLSTWLLLLSVGMGLIGLGMVVVNVGALYRIRYVFSMLIIVLATGGMAEIRKFDACETFP